MNTRDEAIRVIREQTLVSGLATSKDIARKLEYAGLLAPDLPEPDGDNFLPHGREWSPGGAHSVWTVPGGQVMVKRIGPAGLTPEEAREVAHALLAAANYSQEGNRE